jgi:hypothetical protein
MALDIVKAGAAVINGTVADNLITKILTSVIPMEKTTWYDRFGIFTVSGLVATAAMKDAIETVDGIREKLPRIKRWFSELYFEDDDDEYDDDDDDDDDYYYEEEEYEEDEEE